MKFATLVVIGALLATASAQFPFFGGFGFGGFGAGPGLFGRIFPPFIPHMRPGLPIRNGFALFPFGGKRDVEAVGGAPVPEETVEFKALCSVSTLTSTLACNGLDTWTNFECPIEPRGNVTRFKLILEDLIAEKPVTREPVDALTLLSRRAGAKFTYINPINRTEQFVSVFWNPESKLNGFWVKEEKCYQKFVQVVRDVPSAQLKISMFSSP